MYKRQTLTASVQQAEVRETLRAVQMVKERLGVKTVLGVSNISFGLPEREIINTAFLTLALAHGLDLPIINPNNRAMMNAVDAFNVLYNRDTGAGRYLERHAANPEKSPSAAPNATGYPLSLIHILLGTVNFRLQMLYTGPQRKSFLLHRDSRPV